MTKEASAKILMDMLPDIAWFCIFKSNREIMMGGCFSVEELEAIVFRMRNERHA
ncbi:hypothetical protein LCGC14_1371870 [marine sediment metagenome]|uniref:Uncharacterized protein n=1 Tax=marine sediment metagenome TaxID=412755 RepID=A0A0F9N766_9ZZZZ